eukprot:TRINITY_DN5309_c0_g1_i3.p2 TRINITY_DN5309_c0_g1~~TRINITY_DN5309_c0_g1_i3.p2  ORF type:complete len:100 (-),score=5.76 TRINITY_DN5309_c0_g1_i3:39-338(-)
MKMGKLKIADTKNVKMEFLKKTSVGSKVKMFEKYVFDIQKKYENGDSQKFFWILELFMFTYLCIYIWEQNEFNQEQNEFFNCILVKRQRIEYEQFENFW